MGEYSSRVRAIARSFRFEGALDSFEELRAGHINSTYCLTMVGGRRYLLQRVNGYVFKRPEQVMRNIERVTAHLRRSYERDGIDPARRVLTLIEAVEGGHHTIDADGSLWRAYDFIEGATARSTITDPAQMREVGRAFGEFQRRLSDFDAATIAETIEGFHDTPRRFEAFGRAIDAAPPDRRAAAARDVDECLSRGHLAGAITARLDRGELPTRVTHNDTKINNVMLDDRTGEGLCVIDLDTIMPGSVLYDFGDAIRYGAATAAEDEPDAGKMALDMDKYRLFEEGFLSANGEALTALERVMLPVGAWMMTYEVGMRFLTDYLDGDRYFRVGYPEHNLVRARSQMALLRDIERRLPGAIKEA